MTSEELEARIVRYGDLIPCKTAFIDAHTPGSDQKENFTIIGGGVSESPDQHIHIKDRLLRGTTVPLGEGNADLTLCFNLLRNYNYKGNFSMQTARDESGNHVEVMLKYIDMVKKNINANY